MNNYTNKTYRHKQSHRRFSLHTQNAQGNNLEHRDEDEQMCRKLPTRLVVKLSDQHFQLKSQIARVYETGKVLYHWKTISTQGVTKAP